MTKVDIKRLDSVTKNDTTATERINDNFLALQTAIENTLSRDGTGPNYMDADLDMNSYRIINSANPTEDNDIVNLKYVEERIGGAVEASKTAVSAASQAASSAQSALVSSTNAINTLRNTEEQLNNVIKYVDDSIQTIDNTIAEAVEDVKQQALDAAQESIDTAAEQATAIVVDHAENVIKPELTALATAAAESASLSRTWATGSDDEVQVIEPDEHSSRTYANFSMALANAPEDVPVLESTLLATDVVKGPKGDKGDKGEDGKDGGGLEIGDVAFAVMGIDETKNLRRYLNGQVISQSQFESFTNWVKERAKLYPNTVATEENWQAEVTNSKLGQCGKFVIDDALGTIRLPKVVNINGLQDLALMGSIKAESLPNITGDLTLQESGFNTPNGAFYATSTSTAGIPNGNGENALYKLGFNASNSSSIYQDNAPVQQEAIQYPYFIQVATGVEESVDVTREIELNNPFSLLDYKWSEYELNNASWLISNGAFHSADVYYSVYVLLWNIKNGDKVKSGVSVKTVGEDYGDYDFVVDGVNRTFRLPIKVKLASGNAVVGNGKALGLTNGTQTAGMVNDGNAKLHAKTEAYGVNTGVTKSSSDISGSDITVGITTDPTKSGIETSSDGLKLYFYVGETIQDANVINASGVLTRVAELSNEYIVGLGMPDYTAGIQAMSSNTGQREFIAEFDCLFQVRFLSAGYCHWQVNDGNAPDQLCGSSGTNYTQVPIYLSKGTKMTGKGSGGSWNVYVYPLKGVN